MKFINKKSLATVAGFASIFLVMAINSALSANQAHVQPAAAKVQYPLVSITQATPITEQARVSAYGEVESRNQLELTSQVSGKVIYVSPKFLTGNTFKKGELLAQIEPIEYQQALASAQLALADAKLALAQEQLNSEQAAQEWQQSGLASEQASDLVLRKPQLQVAQAQYKLAEKEVAQAQYNLAQTQVVAPFDALVVSKQIHVGSNMQSGAVVAMLYDIAVFEVALPLSAQQWQLLPVNENSEQGLAAIEVLLTDETGLQQWTAKIERFEQHIDEQSRQRALIATIKQPLLQATPLFPGTFVQATLSGQAIKQLWKLPASALIDNNKVWQVNTDGLLSYLPITLVFSQGNYIYVQPLTEQAQATIVNRPLASYLVNMKVEAVSENDNSAIAVAKAKASQGEELL